MKDGEWFLSSSDKGKIIGLLAKQQAVGHNVSGPKMQEVGRPTMGSRYGKKFALHGTSIEYA